MYITVCREVCRGVGCTVTYITTYSDVPHYIQQCTTLSEFFNMYITVCRDVCRRVVEWSTLCTLLLCICHECHTVHPSHVCDMYITVCRDVCRGVGCTVTYSVVTLCTLLLCMRHHTPHLLHLGCNSISISNLNLLGLYSTERSKRDLEN